MLVVISQCREHSRVCAIAEHALKSDRTKVNNKEGNGVSYSQARDDVAAFSVF
jgi:hypothetical protein